MPIRINNGSDRHTQYFNMFLSLPERQSITYSNVKGLMFHAISPILRAFCKWQMICGIYTEVIAVIGESKRNCSIEMIREIATYISRIITFFTLSCLFIIIIEMIVPFFRQTYCTFQT